MKQCLVTVSCQSGKSNNELHLKMSCSDVLPLKCAHSFQVSVLWTDASGRGEALQLSSSQFFYMFTVQVEVKVCLALFQLHGQVSLSTSCSKAANVLQLTWLLI